MKEALELALEALKLVNELIAENKALKAALAQREQEPVQWSAYEYDGIHHKPVAWMDRDGNFSDNNDHKCFPIPLYTITHPQRPWVGLTDEDFYGQSELQRLAMKYAEAKLKEKNI